MRKSILILVAALGLLVGLSGTPAGANSYPGLHEKSWTWHDAVSGDAYTLTARIAIEVTSDGTQGRLRYRLQCFRTDGDTGRRTINSCDFRFGDGSDAMWCRIASPTAHYCVFRQLSNRYDVADTVWVGSWHTLANGNTYAVQAGPVRATFNGGSGHTTQERVICSRTWTKGVGEGGLYCNVD